MKNKTNLVIVLQSLPFNSPFLRDKLIRLISRGWQIRVVCLEKIKEAEQGFAFTDELQKLKGRIHYASSVHPAWKAAFMLPLLLLRSLVVNLPGTWGYFRRGIPQFKWGIVKRFYLDSEIIAQNPAMIHFEFGTLAVNRMHLGEMLDAKLVVSFRGYDLNHVALNKEDYYKEVWEKADALHLLGQDLWTRAQARGCPAWKMHVLISPAIDVGFFDPGDKKHEQEAGTPERPFQLVSVGRLVWKKGHEYALQAVRLLLDQGIHCRLVIIGSGNHYDAIAYAIRDLNLIEHVEMLGDQKPGEVRDWLKKADVFVHAAVSEGFCNAVVEAQAMKLPVVTTDADGLKENVADGKTGFVLPRREPKAMAEKLARLAKDPALRQRMGEEGRLRAVRFFNLEDQIERFNAFYSEVMRSSGKRG